MLVFSPNAVWNLEILDLLLDKKTFIVNEINPY